MRVLIRYKTKEDSALKTCVRESTTMSGAEDILFNEKPDIKIIESSIIENGRDYQILSGGYMITNGR